MGLIGEHFFCNFGCEFVYQIISFYFIGKANQNARRTKKDVQRDNGKRKKKRGERKAKVWS